ncbi:MAG: sigma-70 family RNA polymerase sigma factor [Planctomycetota bacterium]
MLYDRFSSRLIQVAQRRIGSRLGRRVDGEDVVQSVFRTFFRRARLGEYAPSDSALLWGRLVRVTLNKSCDAARAQTAGKRNIFAEDPGFWDEGLVEVMGRSPSPDQAAVLTELLHALLESLGAPEYVSIVELTLQGFDKSEIAQQVGVSRRTVDRVLARSRCYLEDSMKNQAQV